MEKNQVDDFIKLEALLANPPTFESLVTVMRDKFVEYDTIGGFACGHALCYEGDVAVQKLFVAGGTIFPEHTHEQFEYLITIHGEGTYTIDGETKEFQGLDCVLVRPGQVHTWHYKTATKQIIITIPASEGFPRDQG